MRNLWLRATWFARDRPVVETGFEPSFPSRKWIVPQMLGGACMVCSDHVDEAQVSPDISHTCCPLVGNPRCQLPRPDCGPVGVPAGRAPVFPAPGLGQVLSECMLKEWMDLFPGRAFSQKIPVNMQICCWAEVPGICFLIPSQRAPGSHPPLRDDLIGLTQKGRGSP